MTLAYAGDKWISELLERHPMRNHNIFRISLEQYDSKEISVKKFWPSPYFIQHIMSS